MRKCLRIASLAALIIGCLCVVFVHAEENQETELWTRVTMLLEPAPFVSVERRQNLIPGGVRPTAGSSADEIAAFDADALSRVGRMYEKILELEETMRLSTLMVRQYEIELPLEHKTALPTLDVNPRLGTSITLTDLTPDIAAMGVVFHYAKGAWETPEFSGDPITIALQDADLRDVLGVFSKIVGKEIIVDPEITGTVAVDFRQVPWDEALDHILRISDLGWVMDGDAIRVSPIAALNQRREVLAQAAVAVGRGPGGLAMVAGRNGHETPTVVLMVEPLKTEPPQAGRHASWVRFTSFDLPEAVLKAAADSTTGDLAVIRGTVTTEGEFKNAKVLRSPSPDIAAALVDASESWRLSPMLEGAGHYQEVVFAFGVRLLADISSAGGEQFGFEVRVEQDEAQSTGKVLNCRLNDLESGETLVSTRVHSMPGGGSSARASFVKDGVTHQFKLEVEVDAEGRVSTYYWQVTRAGRPIASQRASVDM